VGFEREADMDQNEKLDQLQGKIEGLKKRIDQISDGADRELMKVRDRLDKLEKPSTTKPG
jgi:uncharacterized coiled-coil DUF342 family protein